MSTTRRWERTPRELLRTHNWEIQSTLRLVVPAGFHVMQAGRLHSLTDQAVSGGPGVPPDYRNDDWSTVSITIPFPFCFYGQQINAIYINNNGNVSINTAYSLSL